ncbi:hypothetical protein ABZY16_30480, partial [Streptomyces sp. NPDC006553]
MTSDLSAAGPAAPGRAAPVRAAPGASSASPEAPDRPRPAVSGRLVSERVVSDWEFAVPPGAAGSFWDGVDPVEGLDVFTGALARGAGPLPDAPRLLLVPHPPHQVGVEVACRVP